jgi:hypothetical protein
MDAKVLKEKLEAIKRFVFDTTPLPTNAPAEIPATVTPQNFTDYTLQDGTVVQIDNLAQGGTVTINGQPAPDGTITLTDGTVITITGGIITALQATAPQAAAPAPAMMSADEFNSFKTDFESYKQGIEQQFTEQKAQLAKQDAIITKQQEAVTKLLSLVEEMAKVPNANPVDAPKNNFSTQTATREEKLETLSKTLKLIREEKNK